jgi:hypothetical protein
MNHEMHAKRTSIKAMELLCDRVERFAGDVRRSRTSDVDQPALPELPDRVSWCELQHGAPASRSSRRIDTQDSDRQQPQNTAHSRLTLAATAAAG